MCRLQKINRMLVGMGIACSVLTATEVSATDMRAASGAKKSPFVLVSATEKTLTTPSESAADRKATEGTVSKDAITFFQKSIRLVVHTGPENDMLSYRIDGLRNPRIVVPRGATLRMLFTNNDGDMLHDIRFGLWRTSFPNTADVLLKTSVGTAPLPHTSGAVLHASELVVKAPMKPGKYAYFCTVRGHAQGGMRGTVQVQ